MFEILDNGLRLRDGALDYAYFHLTTSMGERWRVVTLLELRYLPIETRDDPDVLGKQWAALRGLYNAGVDFVYTACGRFAPDHIGVSQFYGAAAEGRDESEAVTLALHRRRAVQAVLANYPQARLELADGERVSWLADFIHTRTYALACLGHPDPRQAKRGLGRDGALGDADEDLVSVKK